MAFTKSCWDPSDTKFAMIDRSIAHLVRSIGKNAHTDNEFRSHMSKPDQQIKLSTFRIFVCLVGATKLIIKGVPSFQPNLALANKIFDYLDNQMIVGEYNLPKRSPRKSLKREENLRTMTVMNAVGKVFMYKQSAVEFDSGRLGEDGKPQPFRWTMLYDVVRQLVPSPELIFMAWSQSLDYNIGTAAHTFAAMTAVCEVFGITVGQWMKKPPADSLEALQGSGSGGSGGIQGDPFGDQFAGAASESVVGVSDARFMDADEANRANDTRQTINTQQSADDKFSEFPSIMAAGGISKADLSEILVGMERSRRATSLYRHRCTIEGNSEIVMNDPMKVIESIMRKEPQPHDSSSDAPVDSPLEYLPIYPSCIMANAVQVSVLHHSQAVVQWLSGNAANAKTHVSKCAEVGAASFFEFSKSKKSGACIYNTAWLRNWKGEGCSGWMHFARDVVNSNATCKLFDLPQNGFRDLVYMLSTRDNNRRCTEEPRVPYLMGSNFAFTTRDHAMIGDSTPSEILMRGISDSRTKGDKLAPAGKEALPRHPYSKVPDVALQRSLDFAMNAGRFPAIMPLLSNNVTDGAPVRIVPDGEKKCIELNTAAALEHTKMMAEGILRASFHPGLQNEQEMFCGDQGAPEGLCAKQPSSQDDSDEKVTKLPYSYDIMSIALTLDGMSRFYDPIGRKYAQMFADAFGSTLGLDVSFEELPHMSLRFVGLKEEEDRRLLSLKIPETRGAAFGAIEVGELTNSDAIAASQAMVSVMIGHYATDDEVVRYLQSRQGSRSMSGVSGDLLSLGTWLKHSNTVLKERGMVSGEDDIVVAMVADEPYSLRSRVTEHASIAINSIVESDHRMLAADDEHEGDELLSHDKLQILKTERKQRIRNDLYQIVDLPEHLEDLRHCGPLQLTHPTNKRTYHNTKVAAVAAPEKPGKREHRSINAATAFEDTDRMMRKALKSSYNKPTQHHGVTARGLRDSRVRANGR